jgi:hypothetical protein
MKFLSFLSLRGKRPVQKRNGFQKEMCNLWQYCYIY